uniref:4-nitrophenylphosphatase n=1 Tax=Timema poppense TaxID=170557 RepID=A0A7R9CXS6_TIMPO|nr:unnamed protein product [Timema poppensis]
MAQSSPITDLSSLNKKEIAAFLDSFDTVISDCDGVLWRAAEGPISGSPQTINKLKSLGKKVFLMSNNSASPLERYVTLCEKMGMPISKENIITPSAAVAYYLKEQNLENKKIFVLGTSHFMDYLREAGLHCSENGPYPIVEDLPSLMRELSNLDSDVGTVVIDTDPNINFIKMMKAVQYLKKPDCHFILAASDVSAILTKDLNLIGPGCFSALLEKFTGRTPIVMGKPEVYMVHLIEKIHPLNPSRTLMIGDSLDHDILLGSHCGFQTLFVLSGHGALEDATDENNMPKYYLNKLGDLLPLLSSQ